MTRPDVGVHGDLVAHGACRQIERRLAASQLGGPILQAVDRRVIAVPVVAHLRSGHCMPHLLRWLGDGVGAEVNAGVHAPHHTGLACYWPAEVAAMAGPASGSGTPRSSGSAAAGNVSWSARSVLTSRGMRARTEAATISAAAPY